MWTVGPNLAVSTQNGIDLIGPTVPVVSPQSKIPDGITAQLFDIDLTKQQAICPNGFAATPDFGWKGKIRFIFPAEVCAACALRGRCCTGKGGRTVCVGDTYPLLHAARKREKAEEFKTDYHMHRSGVEGCVSALARGNGMRTSRYIGNRKRHLQAVFCGTAANIKRAAHWLAGNRPRRYYQAWGLISAAQTR